MCCRQCVCGITTYLKPSCTLFQATASTKFAPFPPKISNALPIVRSTFPLLALRTTSRSLMLRAPPAYVTGILHHSESFVIKSRSTPSCRPSLSAAWTRNSEQNGCRTCIVSVRDVSFHSKVMKRTMPLVISISVIVCHLFIATNQVSSLRLQERSRTSFDLSLPSVLRIDCNLANSNLPSGKRKDVTITYHFSAY